jgi:hypothetical protein
MIVVRVLVSARYNYDMSSVVSKASAMALIVITIFSSCLTWLAGILITIIGSGN